MKTKRAIDPNQNETANRRTFPELGRRRPNVRWGSIAPFRPSASHFRSAAVVSTGRRNTYLEGEMECGLMGHKFHRGFTAAEKTELWDRWKRGESLKAIGRAFGKQSSSIYFLVAPHGGIRPAQRRRSRLALTLVEREVISRRVTAHRARVQSRLEGPPARTTFSSRSRSRCRVRETCLDLAALNTRPMAEVLGPSPKYSIACS